MLLSQAAGLVSSGNLSTFDITGSKVHQIVGHNNCYHWKQGNKVACGNNVQVSLEGHFSREKGW